MTGRWPSPRPARLLWPAAALSVLAVAACSSPSGGAQPWSAATVAVAPVDLPDDAAAVALLRRAAERATSLSFEGVTMTSAAGGGAERVAVLHVPGSGTMVSAEDTGMGQVFPEAGEHLSLTASLRFLDILVARFAVVVAGDGQALSRPADVVEARDGRDRVAARFWVDRRSGLMVKREIIDLGSGAVRSAEFVSLQVPATRSLGVSRSSSPDPTLDPVAVARLRSEGWVCPEGLPGGLVLVTADEADAGAVHLVYSDGLDIVSLFVQRGRLDPGAMPDMAREVRSGGVVLSDDSVTPTWVWGTSGSVVTLMTDAPAATVEKIIAALPPDPGQG